MLPPIQGIEQGVVRIKPSTQEGGLASPSTTSDAKCDPTHPGKISPGYNNNNNAANDDTNPANNIYPGITDVGYNIDTLKARTRRRREPGPSLWG